MRQTQFVQAEHGQGERGKEGGEGNQHPRRLQACLQVEFGAEQAHQCAKRGKAGGHGDHIGQRQAEAAQAADLSAQHHAREDRQHRQHAGREGQAQAGEKEQQQFMPAECCGSGTAAGGGAVRRGVRGRQAASGSSRNGQACGFRRIAQALVGAALVGQQQGKGLIVSRWQRQLQIEHAVVDLDIAEVLVLLVLARRQLQFAEGNAGWLALDAETVTVEVIAFGIDEAQLDGAGRALDQAWHEGFRHRQEVAAVVQWCAQLGRGTRIEQTCAGGQAQQQEQEWQQAAHGQSRNCRKRP